MIRIKRAYEKPEKSDGYRILVDRVWPRGKTKAQLALDEWSKSLAPSTALRKWFNHDPMRWDRFRERYHKELRSDSVSIEKLRELAQSARRRSVTLVYGAHDERHNQAVVLKQAIEQMSGGSRRT